MNSRLDRSIGSENKLQPELNPASGRNGIRGPTKVGKLQEPHRYAEVGAVEKIESLGPKDELILL